VESQDFADTAKNRDRWSFCAGKLGPDMHQAPLRIVTPAWWRLVVRPDKTVDRRAYTFVGCRRCMPLSDAAICASHPVMRGD
jgi:hypothetical protein